MDDKILKYMSDLMSGKEKAEFEAELKANDKLRNEYELIRNSLGTFKETANISFDDRYMNNLVTRARKREHSSESIALGADISFALQGLFSFVFVFILIFRMNMTTADNLFAVNNLELYNAISQSDNSVIEEYLGVTSNEYALGDFEKSSISELSDYGVNELLEYQKENYQNEINNYLESFDETELNDLVSSLKDKKIL